MAIGTKLFFDMMHLDPPKVMLFGGSCSHVTAPIAESAKWWDISQVSEACFPVSALTGAPNLTNIVLINASFDATILNLNNITNLK